MEEGWYEEEDEEVVGGEEVLGGWKYLEVNASN